MKNSQKLFEISKVQNSEEYFSKLTHTLKENITTWDYFVNWSKVIKHIENIELELNILNYLIGKSEGVIKSELKTLLNEYPKVAQVIPTLVAFREKQTKVLTSYNFNEFIYKDYFFEKKEILTDSDINDIIEFADKTGILKLFYEGRIKNIVDYVIGVEVGLDSNGRKNRTGTLMEKIVELFISEICKKNKFEYISQANSKKIKEKWGLKLTVDKSSRLLDFAINTPQRLFLVETNFYAGVGSKIKSTAGEYKTMSEYWKNDGHEFIWITDGYGWKTTLFPLREAFDNIDYILNLQLVSEGVLEEILTEDFNL
ncbi:type II restriction endonuclease [bacterium]|nr:type II restriction endonuclease [bacterium]